jgi:hypothetical protein
MSSGGSVLPRQEKKTEAPPISTNNETEQLRAQIKEELSFDDSETNDGKPTPLT